MSKFSMTNMAINGAGVALVVFIAAFMIRSALVTETEPPCSARYPAATEFSLKSQSGKLMSAIELEARMGSQSVGFLENASVVKVESGPAPEALRVRLRQGSGSVYQKAATPGGVSHRWAPSGMTGATAACLSYSVWLPEDFDFGGGGVLPGVLAGHHHDPRNEDKGTSGVLAAPVWRQDGTTQVDVYSSSADGRTSNAMSVEGLLLPRGRWVSLEEEVVLNAPGAADGILRLWLDGALRIERKDVAWRTDDQMLLSGVLADVSYGGLENSSIAPTDTEIRVTPLTLRWK